MTDSFTDYDDYSRRGRVDRIRHDGCSHGGSCGGCSSGCGGNSGSSRGCPSSRAVVPSCLVVGINPATNVRGHNSGKCGGFTIYPRKRGSTMIIQYEGFSFLTATTGNTFVTLTFCLSHIPLVKTHAPVFLKYGGKSLIGYIQVDPSSMDMFTLHFSHDGETVSTPNICVEVAGGVVAYCTNENR